MRKWWWNVIAKWWWAVRVSHEKFCSNYTSFIRTIYSSECFIHFFEEERKTSLFMKEGINQCKRKRFYGLKEERKDVTHFIHALQTLIMFFFGSSHSFFLPSFSLFIPPSSRKCPLTYIWFKTKNSFFWWWIFLMSNSVMEFLSPISSLARQSAYYITSPSKTSLFFLLCFWMIQSLDIFMKVRWHFFLLSLVSTNWNHELKCNFGYSLYIFMLF